MKRKLSPIHCAIAMTAILATAASAQTPQAPPKAPPSPAVVGVPPPTLEALHLAAQIAAYATAQCGGKDATAAPDCRVKELWTATQCPDQMITEPGGAQMESRPCVVPEPGVEYEVASIKPHKDDGTNGPMVGPTADGYRAINVTMRKTLLYAYSAGVQLEITGEPAWMNDTHYDIEAKFVPEVAEALKKLMPDDRSFVQRYMMQQILKDRMNFAAHVDTKEVPAYDLVVGKNGPKMKAADPNAKDNGSMSLQPDQVKIVLTGKGMQMTNLASRLSGAAGRPVFDKTGLTGIYDFTLEIARDQDLSAGLPGEGATGPAVPRVSDPSGRTVTAALEDQLGLKLVPSRGPMQVVVIERMEKPDAN